MDHPAMPPKPSRPSEYRWMLVGFATLRQGATERWHVRPLFRYRHRCYCCGCCYCGCCRLYCGGKRTMQPLASSLALREERRVLRENIYRNIEELEAHRQDIRAGTQKSLEILDSETTLLDRIKHAREGALDANFIKQYTHESALGIRSSSTSAFDTGKFIRLLQAKYAVSADPPSSVKATPSRSSRKSRATSGASSSTQQDGAESDGTDVGHGMAGGIALKWDAIGRDVLTFWLRSTIAPCMSGPIQVMRKERKRGARTKRIVPDVEKKPLAEDIENSRDVNPTITRMLNLGARINSKLKHRKTYSFVKPFLDPKSFCKSIENLYYLEFLGKDGKIAMDLKNEEPVISQVPADGPVPEQKQFIFTFNYAKYLYLKNKLASEKGDEAEAETAEEPSSRRRRVE